MTKSYQTYQYLEGTPMTDRDVKEQGSKFWNKGKWDNFVAPFLPEDCSEQTFIDMGCNAGLFLKFAEDKGFKNIIGVDSNEEAIKRGVEWRDNNGGNYRLVQATIEDCIDELPLADYTVLANAHYYFTINDWIDYLDKLQYKTRYVIIVTAEKKHINRCWASADVPSIRNYFKTWEEVGFIDELPTKDDPQPRRLWGLCFKSPFVDKVAIDSLDSSNHVQDQFYEELDNGTPYKETKYYKILKKYREKWGEEKLNRWIEERIRVYNDIKEYGLKRPVLVDFFKQDRILDGNHRYAGVRNLGYKNIFIRKV